MDLGLFNNPLAFFFWLASIVIAITIHEFSHAYAAEHLGDPTPRLQGRLTLNPLAHLDVLGTLMLIIAHFGWGKPVMFDPFNLKNPRRDGAIISIAGPVSNLILALICSVLLRLTMNYEPLPMNLFIYTFSSFLHQLIIMNVILAVFNLVPIHPLDGFKIVSGILPEEYARQWQELERYGMIFLLFLIFPLFGGSSPIQQLISPVISFLLSLFLPSTRLI